MRKDENQSSIFAIITTSHNPSHFLRRVCKFLSHSLPTVNKITRGSLTKTHLLNYCKKKEINRLLIVQGTGNERFVNLECYFLEKSVHPLNVRVELTNFNFPQKGVKNTRITIDQIELEYSQNIPSSVQRKINSFMEPYIESKPENIYSSLHTISFYDFTSNVLYGKSIYSEGSKHSLLFEFRISI